MESKKLGLWLLIMLAPLAVAAQGMGSCTADAQKYCAQTSGGSEKILDCLLDHQQDVSDACYNWMSQRLQSTPSGNAGGGSGQGNQPSNSGVEGGARRGPPPEALNACRGMSSGASCHFADREDQPLDGTCFAPESNLPLACRPNHGGPGDRPVR
jgi:hypothetical protein